MKLHDHEYAKSHNHYRIWLWVTIIAIAQVIQLTYGDQLPTTTDLALNILIILADAIYAGATTYQLAVDWRRHKMLMSREISSSIKFALDRKKEFKDGKQI